MVIKVDQSFGTIGFQQTWLDLQGYKKKNLAELIFNKCIDVGLDVLFLTSEEKRIPKGSVHDRFSYIIKKLKKLDDKYNHNTIDDVGLIIEKENKKLLIVNSQVCIAFYGNMRVDHLIVGSNQIQNDGEIKLEEALEKAKDKGLIQILPHPASQSSEGFVTFGGGYEILEKFRDYYDAIVIHDSTVSGEENEKAQEMASKYKIPGIAFSNAHYIEYIGLAYSILDCELDLSSGEKLISSLKEGIKTLDTSKCFKGYIPDSSKIKEESTFKEGLEMAERSPESFEQEKGYKIVPPKK